MGAAPSIPFAASTTLIVLSALLISALAVSYGRKRYQKHFIHDRAQRRQELKRRYKHADAQTRLVTGAFKDSVKQGCAAQQDDMKLLALAGKRDRDVLIALGKRPDRETEASSPSTESPVEKKRRRRKFPTKEIVWRLQQREELNSSLSKLHADLLHRYHPTPLSHPSLC
jgi:hypothetical protein